MAVLAGAADALSDVRGAYVGRGQNSVSSRQTEGKQEGSEFQVVKIEQNRLRSWALWTSIAALAVFCVKEFAGLDISGAVEGFLNVLLPVLVAFGIVNDPTSKNTL